MTPAQELRSLLGSPAERRAWLAELGPQLPAALRERLTRILELAGGLLDLLDTKNLSIKKLQQLFFGAKTENSRNVCGPAPKDKSKAKAKGHGRHSHGQYTGARRIALAHPTLRPGHLCPECKRGKLRRRPRPAVAIHVSAQPPIGATIHELEQLRCDTCGKLFTAPTPPAAGSEKYDASVGVMIGLMRYGSGLPFYRLERLQLSLGVPLPASVQWEQANRVARELAPVFDQLQYLAAQSAVVYSDDTTMKVAALRQAIQKEIRPDRTGIFTTGIVGQLEEHPIALFLTGRAHAGENLAAVLAQREAQRPPPLHMCDGLAQNTPKGQATVACQCTVHARRNFVEIQSDFPEECGKVIEIIAEVYRVEKQIKADGLSAQARLEVHQAQSQPMMEQLKAWLTQQIEDRKVEPNSNLGQAIRYMQDRWQELTQFLRVPGAPLDNNATERILKMSILHRKNSLFYRTERGAEVGDLFMSLVQTCRANQVNPFDYMLAVVRNTQAAKTDPGRWLPWNYRKNLEPTSALSG
jgi:transposase